eukprot:Opistho-2@74168
MTGNFVISGRDVSGYAKLRLKSSSVASDDGSAWPPRFARLWFTMDDGTRVAFVDARRLARVRPLDDPAVLRARLGFDPVHCMPTLEVFRMGLAARGMPIKALLLDQEFSAGVGNWVADEVLFQAGVHPEVRAKELSDAQSAVLHEKLKYVCETAVGLDGECDKYPATWLFHVRWGKGKKNKPITADGHKVEFLTVGGRTSAYVPSLQRKTEGKASDGEGRGAASETVKKQKGRSVKTPLPEDKKEGVPKRMEVAHSEDVARIASGIGKQIHKPLKRRGNVRDDSAPVDAPEQGPPAKRQRVQVQTTVRPETGRETRRSAHVQNAST